MRDQAIGGRRTIQDHCGPEIPLVRLGWAARYCDDTNAAAAWAGRRHKLQRVLSVCPCPVAPPLTKDERIIADRLGRCDLQALPAQSEFCTPHEHAAGCGCPAR
eukprot:350178-Chlamydomonas_euryale.AAC.6